MASRAGQTTLLPGPGLPPVLDLGCGRGKAPGAYGVDALPLPGVDVVHDLDRMPWPLPDAAFREVRAIDVLEHLADFVRAVEECHRVLAPGGRLVVQMPFAGGVNHLTDPTHRRGATSRTFDYFIQGADLQRRYGYSAALFRLERFSYDHGVLLPGLAGRLMALADRLILPWVHRNRDAYEHHLAGLYPMHGVRFELIKV